MASAARPSPLIRFGPFELDTENGELHKAGIFLKIHPQPTRLLVLLVRCPGQIVSRDEIRRCLWGDNTFVDFERGINFCVNQIRAVLGDNPEKPRYIETVPRRGYRFIARVICAFAAAERASTFDSVSMPDLAMSDRESLSAAQLAPGRTVGSHAEGDFKASRRKRWLIAALLLFAAVAAAGVDLYRWVSPGRRPNLERMQITKLTDSGKAEDVAISPDGRYVAYLFRDGKNSSLRLRQIGAAGEAQVLAHEALLFPGLAFSPDGNHLYFLRATPKDPQFRLLYEIPSLGGPERKVTSNVDTAVSFSPDGREFVYESGRQRLDTVEIRIANVDGSGDHLLASLQGAWPGYLPGVAWSPDGNSIAVSVWMHHTQRGFALDILSTANGAARQLYSTDQPIGVPRWLPGGQTLIVPLTDRNGRTQLWTLSYPAGKTRRLTNDLADYNSSIDTTHDGRTLATIQRSITSNLWVSSSQDASSARQLTFGEQKVIDVLSLESGKIAMVNQADNGLWVMNPDGRYPRLVADASGKSWFASCGAFVLFQSDRNQELTRTDEDGANPMQLAAGTMWGETCSPDGKYVYYAEALKPRWKIRRVSIDGGPPVDIEENPGEAIPGRVAISSDGRFLAFPYTVNSPEPVLKIGVFPIAGGPVIKVFDAPGDINGPRWSPDGRALQFLLDKGGATNLWEQPLAGGPSHQLTKFTSGEIFDFNWTADGNQLLLSRGEVTSDVVILTNLR